MFGATILNTFAHALHYVTGFLIYPVGYWVVTRMIRSFGMPADGWIWGVVTYFIALGVIAPLAGQSFLLSDVLLLSLMSLIGQAIYGYIAALVFEHFEQSRS
jgi:thiol:disulfide interchange protein